MLTFFAKTRPLATRPLTIFTCLRTVLPTMLGAVVGLLLLFGSLPATFADAPTLFAFSGADGSGPQAALVQGHDGNFYGTTYGGGSQNKGTIFKLTPAGVLTTLVSFNGTNGAYSSSGLILGRDGNFYGTTIFGGSNNHGTVYRMRTNGTAAGTTLKTLVKFNGTNGDIPFGRLVQASDGSFYGTTVNGGSHNTGTIFKITTDGTPAGTTLTSLYSLVPTDQQYPYAGLIQGRDGSFYGTMWNAHGYGAVFKLTTDGTPAGTAMTVLINFNAANGANPLDLILGLDGNLYGTTYYGGAGASYVGAGYGTVYKITTDGTPGGTVLTTLVSFDGSKGVYPHSALVQGNDGSFYGTTVYGGSAGSGTIFKVTTDGTAAGTTLRTLVNFNVANGNNPYAPLVQGSDGYFYGTTLSGGSSNNGTIFKLFASSFAIESLTFLPATVTGGSTTTGEVALNHLAVLPAVVALTSSDPSVLSVRSSVTVTSTHRHAVFTAFTHPVATPTDVTITATSYGVTKTSIVHVTP